MFSCYLVLLLLFLHIILLFFLVILPSCLLVILSNFSTAMLSSCHSILFKFNISLSLFSSVILPFLPLITRLLVLLLSCYFFLLPVSPCIIFQAEPQYAPDWHNLWCQRYLHQRHLPGHPGTKPSSHVSAIKFISDTVFRLIGLNLHKGLRALRILHSNETTGKTGH